MKSGKNSMIDEYAALLMVLYLTGTPTKPLSS